MTEQNNMVAVIAVANHKRDHDNMNNYFKLLIIIIMIIIVENPI